MGGFDGTYTGGVIPGAGTLFLDGSPTAKFDGSSGYVLLPHSQEMSPKWNKITVEAWVYLDNDGNDFQAILSPPGHGFVHFQSFVGGNNVIYYNLNPPVGIDLPIYPFETLKGKWHYVAIVGESLDSRLYLDGKRFGKKNTAPLDTVAQSGDNLRIGSGYGPGRFWNGSIANVSIFNIALTDQQILSRYQSYVQDTCPSAHGVTVAGGNGRGGAANQLAQPNGLFVDQYGSVWVADTHNGRIQKWAPGATSGTTIGAGLLHAPSFPTNVFVDKIGNLYAADYFSSKVVKFSFGKNSWKVVAKGMDLTRGVWVDKDGNVYATDYGNNRVLKFVPGNLTGVVVAGGNGYGNALNQLARPVSVFVDDKGNVYVTDQDNDRIVKWKPGAVAGSIVAGGNGTGNAANQFNSPDFVFVDEDNNVFVTDRNNDRVQKWVPGATEGVTVAGGNGTGSGHTKFNQPYGGIVDAKNYLYVADHENDRVQRFNLNNGRIAGKKHGLCGGGTFAYSFMPAVSGTSYTWSVPAGCTILSGQGTADISVSIPADFRSGEISVVADPGTCKGNFSKDELSVKPARLSEITGPSFVDAGQMSVGFSIILQAGVDYNWKVPVGAVIASGQGTNSVTVNWGTRPGFIIARTLNCDDSSGRKLYVHVNGSGPFTENAIANATTSRSDKFLIYPNPAMKTCTVLFRANQQGKYRIELTDLMGKTMQFKTGITAPGENEITFDISKYAKGTYFINLTDGNGTRSLKLYKE